MSTANPDRRTHPRLVVVTNGSNPLVATMGIVPRAAVVCDLSPGGLALLSTDPPAVDSVVPVWLAIPPGAASLRLLFARTVHVTAVDGDLYRVGFACLDESGMALLRQTLALLTSGS